LVLERGGERDGEFEKLPEPVLLGENVEEGVAEWEAVGDGEPPPPPPPPGLGLLVEDGEMVGVSVMVRVTREVGEPAFVRVRVPVDAPLTLRLEVLLIQSELEWEEVRETETEAVEVEHLEACVKEGKVDGETLDEAQGLAEGGPVALRLAEANPVVVMLLEEEGVPVAQEAVDDPV